MNSQVYWYRNGDQCALLTWLIPTFDERVSPPFPLQRWWYVLDWTQLQPAEAAYIAAKYEFDRHVRTTSDGNRGPISTLAVSTAADKYSAGRDMLQFRKHFTRISEEDLGRLQQSPPTPLCSFSGVNIHPEYFEDREGNEVGHADIAERMHGH